ncbi:MAG: PQQ-dependent sugar dehydrogenase [Gemmatimonadaceae bacterium]|jgi:glucose/arabinose dehydrogenase|nr:PQQ-dependent sugar dehydrogenase [Gemmatimonadaceae bacterium]
MHPALRVAPLVFLAALAACGTDRGAPATGTAVATPAVVRAVTPLPSEAEVGSTMADSPTVDVRDARGQPVVGALVHFATTGGALSDSVVRTDGSGRAAVQWTLGERAGEQHVTARVGDLPTVTFAVSAFASRSTRLVITRGDAQTGVAGASLAIDPQVRVIDRFGNGIARISLVVTPDAGSGTATPVAVVSDALGFASTAWTLGTTLGAQRLTVSSPTNERLRVTVSATATTGAAAQHVVFAGNNQVAPAYGSVAVRPATRVLDGNNNPVRGVPVTFVVISGGGSVTGADVVTDDNGVATVGAWTLGGIVGTQTLAARSPGLPEASLTATATVPASGTITVAAGNNQTAPTGALVPIAPSVVVRDAGARPLGGVAVTFGVTAGGGTVTPTTVTTDAAGVATVTSWRLGTTAGANTLVASRAGFASAVFAATATAVGVPTLERTVLVGGLQNPWDLAFTPENAMLFTERAGRLRVRLESGVTRLLYQPADIRAQDQGGLLGVAVDPEFASNRFIYVMMSTNVAGGRVENRVRRLRVNADYTAIDSPVDIVDSIPWGNGGAHNGGRLRFGTDGFLYVGSGDNRSGPIPQRVTGLGGKVLRVTRNGDPAPGNPTGFGPTAHPQLFAIGFRNVQGLAVRPGSGQVFTCEHGPGHSDEVTRIVNGGNGGWDPMTPPDTTYRGYEGGRSMTDLVKFPTAMRPTWTTGGSSFGMSGCGFITGPQWRDWDGALVVSLLSGRRAEVLRLNADGTTATNTPILSVGDRIRAVTQGPDGSLYVLTDGKAGGDEIWRVTPR